MKKHRLTLILMLSITFIFVGCQTDSKKSTASNDSSSVENDSLSSANDTLNLDSIDLKKLETTLTQKIEAQANNKSLPENTVPLHRSDLYNMKCITKIYEGSKDAGLKLPAFGGITLGANEKSIVAYYIESKTIVIDGDTSTYGIGYSIHYLFKKLKKGINVSNLPYVAASVQLENNKTQVQYSIQSYGIIGNPLVKFFKPVVNKPFDVEGFAVIQSAIDGIQNVLSDNVISNQLTFRPEKINITF